MPSIHDPARRQELCDRFGRLRPDTPARWGRFTAPRMVAHVHDGIRMATGELPVKRRPLPLQFLLRPLFVHWLPFPKGAPTAPELLARVPASWDDDVRAIQQAIAALRPFPPGATIPEHPAFGRMTDHDWGHLIYKHCDHHLRQFGV